MLPQSSDVPPLPAVCRRLIAAIALALLAVPFAVPPAPASAQTHDQWCNVQTKERIVAVGDVHGAYDKFVAILRAAGVVDARTRWSGGRTIFVQTGDVLDRGADSRRVLDLLRTLERDAQRAGGRVYPLLGNHEVMRMVYDWRYVSAGELAAFRRGDSAELRDLVLERAVEQAARRAQEAKRPFDEAAFRRQFMTDIPLGYIEMRQAFDPPGDYGKWLRQLPTMIKINGVAFVHGGVSESVAPLGCAGINKAVHAELAAPVPPPEELLKQLSSSENGPLWYRGLAQEPEDTFAPTVTAILRAIDARAIVIGHTPSLPARIATRFDGQVIQIDTGMLEGEFYPGGEPTALEMQGDALTAIRLDRRERLPVSLPAAVAASAAAAVP